LFLINWPIFPEIKAGSQTVFQEPLKTAGARNLTGWIPFLSPNQQCKGTEGMTLQGITQTQTTNESKNSLTNRLCESIPDNGFIYAKIYSDKVYTAFQKQNCCLLIFFNLKNLALISILFGKLYPNRPTF